MGQEERTIRALQVLGGSHESRAELIARFAPGHVRVTLANEVRSEPQAQLLFLFAVNLLTRLFPVVQHLDLSVPPRTRTEVILPRWRAAALSDHLETFRRGIASRVEWPPQGGGPEPALTLAVGPVKGGGATLFAGSVGWIAEVSPRVPVEVSGSPNPIGAYASACLAVAEVFKRLLKESELPLAGVPVVPSEEAIAFSCFRCSPGSQGPNPPLPDCIDLGRLTLVGAGAGGGALAYTLASVRGCRGEINAIEPDEVSDSNLNRLVMADAQDVVHGRKKAAVVESLFADTGVVARAMPVPFSAAADTLDAEDYRYVVSLVHSREARREIQHETPMVLWDAGATSDGAFRVWRHILGQTECMVCKHPRGESDPEDLQAQQLSGIGLSRDAWLTKIRDNAPFSSAEIDALRTVLERGEASLPKVGQRFSDWFGENCGQLRLPDLEEEIPIPFAPVMAGVLLAGEVIKEHTFPEAVMHGYYWNTLLGKFMSVHGPAVRPPTPDCPFCSDAIFHEQYARRWRRAS